MKAFPAFVAAAVVSFLLAVAPQAGGQAAPGDEVTLKTLSGSVVKGVLMSSTGSEASVRTEFGVLRITLSHLDEASRELIQGSRARPASNDALLAKIADLERQLAVLKAENADLRKALAEARAPSGTARTSPGRTSITGGDTVKPEPAGSAHWITSSSSKRHNSGCRYFQSSRGRPCGPNDGIACKICGG